MIKATEQALKGMEISLSSHLSLSTPSLTSHPILKDSLHQLTECTTQTLLNKPSPSTHQTAKQALYTLHHTLEPTSLSLHNLSSLFFIYCLCQLHSETTIPSQNRQSSGPKIAPTVEEPANPQSENHNSSIKTAYCKSLSFTNKESAIWALKCSLSLALSVLLGVLYSKDNGYWAGIGVAISMGATREPTFKLANVRTHGTVAGSIYGVLGCFLAQKIPAVRYIALIPWVIFTSFLRDSKMYGYAGSLSALIGAVIILGRRNFGAPPEFAIARITETFIGVVCYIFVELLIEPTRATRLARLELDRAMTELSGLILSVLFENRESHKEDEKRLRSCIFRLRKFVDEAKNEPDFWFFPFPSDIYTKILGSLCTMLELLSFWASGFEELAHVARAHGAQVDSLIEPVGSEIEWFKGSADSVLRCLAGVMGVGSLKEMSDEFGRVGTCGDLEAGGVTRVTMDEEEVEKMTKSFLENGREVGVGFSGEELKGQLVLCMGCLGFCMEGLMREMKELEKGVRELLEREGIDYSHETCCR
ncbi:hypothetical protein AMTR_s00012p00168340 [Amborella trichopoda]|uniref:Integral membrane bound transporter domain-containing protein n=2 Tax=Amborella trichopoda TaxID=13333 RepID=W1PL05_AMBTC|nr:hypothetical protein AMTR_s00012p00168340 [Amborella trichopoda]